MYQVELTTDMDVVSIVVNASDENEAISIALTMFEQGEVDTAGSMLVNVAAFRAYMHGRDDTHREFQYTIP